jgi:hypothetical protein
MSAAVISPWVSFISASLSETSAYSPEFKKALNYEASPK